MKTVITVKTNSRVKKQAAKLATGFGLSLSDVVNIALNQFVQTKSLHIQKAERPSPALRRAIAKADRDLKAGRVSPIFDNAEDAIKYLGI